MIVDAAAIAAHNLPSRRRLDEGTTVDDFDGLLATCEAHRLLGLLARAVRDGAVVLDEEQMDALEQSYRAWLTHSLRVERLLLDAVAALDQAGIESRVLKGVALAHTAYDDPNERVFGDVDLLVPGDRLAAAAHELAHLLDAERAQPELRPGFDDRFGKEVMLRVGALELDVHRTFVEGAFGLTVDLDDLFAPPYRFPLGICELEALPMPQRFLHASYAAALGDWPPRLGSLRDLAQIVHREQPNVTDVLLMAKRWRCAPVVARAVVETWDELKLERDFPVVRWARRFEPDGSQRRMLAWHQGPARAFTRHLAAVTVLDGFGDRVAYVRAIMLPQREYLRARGLSASGHARRVWDRMTG